MNKLIKIVNYIEDWLGPICLLALVLVLSLQIAGRWLGQGSFLTWTDEVARLFFVASIFLSLPLAFKRKAMIYIKISPKLWPLKFRPKMPKVSNVLWVLALIILITISLKNAIAVWDMPQKSAILGFNQNIAHLIPLTSMSMVLIRALFELLRKT